jgi:phosphoribosylanthranilate isomerase
MIKVKICGVTSYDDAYQAAQAGADLLGFNFFKRSPRYIEPNSAQAICDRLRKELGAQCPALVGVFVNDVVGHISIVMDKVGLNFVQLSGEESDEMIRELKGIGYKSIQPMNKEQALDDVNYYRPILPTNERIPSLLLDAYHPSLRGGTGEQVSQEIALAVNEQVPRLMLAGGLTPENVAEKIHAIQPWGVDVASGVEIPDLPGKKDHVKVTAFIEAVLGAIY